MTTPAAQLCAQCVEAPGTMERLTVTFKGRMRSVLVCTGCASDANRGQQLPDERTRNNWTHEGHVLPNVPEDRRP